MDKSGYGNCKKNKGIKKHNDSGVHKDSAQAKLVHEKKPPSYNCISREYKQKMQHDRDAIKAVFNGLLFYSRQGVSVGGHTDDCSDFCELQKLLERYNSNVAK